MKLWTGFSVNLKWNGKREQVQLTDFDFLSRELLGELLHMLNWSVQK